MTYRAIRNAYEEQYGAGSWKKIDVPKDVEESEAKPEKLGFGAKVKLSPAEHHRYTEAKKRLAGKLGMQKEGWGLYGRSIMGALKNKEKEKEERSEKSMIADDGKPGKSLKETSTEELKATLAKLKPTDPGAEGRIKAIKGELASRGGGGMEKAKQPSESTSLTPEKARQMLHERSGGHGRPITEQQRKFFGAVGGHLPAPGGKAKKSMGYENLDDFLEKGGIPWGGMTPKGYKKVKGAGGKAQYIKPGEAKKPAAAAAASSGITVDAEKYVENLMNDADVEPEHYAYSAGLGEKQALQAGKKDEASKWAQKKAIADVLSRPEYKNMKARREESYSEATGISDLGSEVYTYTERTPFSPEQRKKVMSEATAAARQAAQKYQGGEKKPAAAAPSGPMTAEAAYKLVNESVMKTGDGKSHRFSDDPAKAQKVLDGLPSGTRVTRYDDSGYHDTSMVKQGNKWITESPDSAQDDWDIDEDVGYETKHEFDSAEMGKIVSRGWNDAHIFLPKAGSAAKSMGDVMSLEDWMEKGGPYIGERGGRWEDPQHTIPWKGDKKPSGGKAKKLNAKQANALRAAAKFGVVPGGAHATFSMVNKLADAGLLESSKENPQVYRPTEAGKQALASGSYKPATKTKGGEAPSGAGVTIKPGMEGKTVKPAGAPGPGVKVMPGMEGKTVQSAAAAGQGRSLGGGVEARVRHTPSGKWAGTIIGKTGKTLPGATGDTAKEALDATEKMFRQAGGGEKKPAGEAPKAGGGGLPEPKISKIGNATIRTYGDVGIIRSQPKLGHTVLDAEGTEIGDVGRHKSLAAAEKYLMRMKKSMGEVMSLDEYLEKSGGLPTHEQGMGHKKSSSVEGGSADGGELADVGRTSGSSDSAPGPEQDGQGQLKGVSPGGKQKLSEDDAEEEKQMTEHKKPIETIKKSRFPADQRESVAHEQAAVVSRLQKSEDVYVGPDRHPFSHYATHASGDLEASELVKSEGFYHGKSPQFAPSRPIIEQGVLCKAVNASGCDESYSAALTSCPSCGAGTVGHRHLPGGSVMGAETAILEKSVGPGSLLRRPTQEPDVKIG